MKNIKSKYLTLCFITAALFISAGFVFAEDSETMFQNANQFYREEKFEEALKIYHELLIRHPNNPYLLYNIGNSFANLGKRGDAVLMWEKAKRIAPRDSDLNMNLLKLSPPQNNPEMFILFKPFSFVKNSISLDEWAIILSVFWFLTLLAFSVKILVKPHLLKKVFSFLGWNSVIILVIVLMFFTMKFYQQEIRKELVLLEDSITAKSGPGEDFPDSMTKPLSVGTKVIQTSSPEQQWVRIRLLNGSASGWVMQDKVGKI